MIYSLMVAFASLLAILVSQYLHWRSERNSGPCVCRYCRSIGQPRRHRNNGLHCRVCGAADPIPLDHPAARRIFAAPLNHSVRS